MLLVRINVINKKFKDDLPNTVVRNLLFCFLWTVEGQSSEPSHGSIGGCLYNSLQFLYHHLSILICALLCPI